MLYPAPPTSDDRDVALFIDWENIKFSLVNAGFQPNVSSLYESAKGYGRIVIARAYADWQEEWHLDDPAALYDAGIEPVYVPTRGKGERRKNSVDVKLAAECIEVCHNYPSIKSFILCSGDADFLHVVNILRPYGKRVVIIGVSWTTSMQLIGGVDEFLFYDQDVEPLASPYQRTSGRSNGNSSAAAVQQSATLQALDNPDLERAARTVLEIVRGSQKEGRALLAYIKHELIKRLGAFDERLYGFSKFKLFMKELERLGLIRVVTRDLVDWAYLPEIAEREGLKEDEGAARTATFDEGTMVEFLRAVERVQRAHEFTSFNFLVGRIYELGDLPLSRTQLKALCNLAVDRGYFERGHHTRVDAATGEISDIRTLVLRRDLPEIIAALNSASGESHPPVTADERLKIVQAELERAPANVTLLQRAAERCVELGRYDEALGYQHALIEAEPEDVRGYCVYARYLQYAGRESEAFAFAAATAERFPDHYMPSWTLGSLYANRGEPQQALQPLRRAQSLIPRDRDDLQANLLWHLARSYLDLGRRDEATHLVEEGLTLHPTHIPLQQLQAQILAAPLSEPA